MIDSSGPAAELIGTGAILHGLEAYFTPRREEVQFVEIMAQSWHQPPYHYERLTLAAYVRLSEQYTHREPVMQDVTHVQSLFTFMLGMNQKAIEVSRPQERIITANFFDDLSRQNLKQFHEELQDPQFVQNPHWGNRLTEILRWFVVRMQDSKLLDRKVTAYLRAVRGEY